MPAIRPAPPPPVSNKRKAEEEEEKREEGQQASPTRKRSRSSSPSSPPNPKRQPIGPSRPPADLSTIPSTNPNDDADSTSSDDDFGPSLPPAPGSINHQLETQRRRQLQDREAATAAAAAKPQREEWMLLPPSADGLNSSRMDPTKLKNRKFQTGKGAKAPSSGSTGIGDTWTETPEQKRQRLEDEVLGRKKPAQLQEAGDGDGARAKTREEDRRAEKRIREYNEKVRGGALMDEGRWTGKKTDGGASKREEEDDPSKRAFDREKDMKVGGAVGYAQKKELLNQARNMGDRFARGSYL